MFVNIVYRLVNKLMRTQLNIAVLSEYIYMSTR
jgi:hypothetical protein